MDSTDSAKREYYAAALTALIGAFAIVEGKSYRIGTLIQMGPGFFPVVLGCILVICGVLLALNARQADPDGDAAAADKLDLRGAACILGGIGAFVLLGEQTGMILGGFSAVFISAMGDRSSTLKSSFILAVLVTLFGVILFHYILALGLPLWGSQ